jgi:LacI family transcriptional regulator
MGPWTPEVYDVVWTDDARGAFEAVQYLQGLEHRAIWFLRNSPRVNPAGLSIHAPSERIYEGYRQAMEIAGLEPQCIENDSTDERDTGYLAVKSFLTNGGKVTAFLAASDIIAQGAYDALRDCGLKVPDDISIVGLGDRPEAAALTPPLTTIRAYADQVGRRLVEFVFKRISHPDLPPQSIVLPTRLVVRSSCAKAPDSPL